MATQSGETDGLVSLGNEEFEAAVGGSGITLVEFYTDWCSTCSQMWPHLRDIAADTVATVVTVDIESNLEPAIEFDAHRTPTFVLFVDGQPVRRLHGGQTAQTLRNLIRRYST